MNPPNLNLMLLICPIHIIFENDSKLLPANPQIKASFEEILFDNLQDETEKSSYGYS